MRTICATANGFDFWCHISHFHSFFRYVDDVHHRFHLLTHIVIGVAQRELQSFITIFGIHTLHQSTQHSLARFKAFTVVVANDESHLRTLHCARQIGEVEEAFEACGVFGGFKFGHLLHKFCGQTGGIDHLVFGITGMDTHSGDVYFGRSGIEIFKLQFTALTAVHGVSPFATKFLDIKLMRAESDFFIGIETYTHFSVFDFGMRQEIFHGRNNFSNTCFVVCAKKGVSVGDNDVFSHVAKEFGEFFHTRHDAGFCIKHNVGAIIVFHNARTHILARSIGTRVHMSYKPNGGYFFVDVGRKSGIYISHFIHFHLRQSNGFQFFH